MWCAAIDYGCDKVARNPNFIPKLIEVVRERILPPGERLFKAGDAHRFFYVVQQVVNCSVICPPFLLIREPLVREWLLSSRAARHPVL